jgi:phenylacetate-CoA ligase
MAASGWRNKLYWRMPYSIRCWMAGRYGRQLAKVRNSPWYYKRLEEIAERDTWTPEQMLAYSNEQLKLLVRHATDHIPFYRDRFADCGLAPASVDSIESLRSLPILEKEEVRSRWSDMVDPRLDRSSLVARHTSGTTGTPVELLRDVCQESTAFAYMDGRCHRQAGIRRGRNRSVSLGGHLVAAPDQSAPPFWVENRPGKQLYMSSYHLAPAYMDSYIDAIRKFSPDYIEGYPSSVYSLARHIISNDLPPIELKAVFTTAETLYDDHRDAFSRAFGCKTYNQYGCGEMAMFVAECEAGSMHISCDYGIIEVVDDHDNPLPAGQVGQLVCTSLVNFTQPFIRYRVGDLGALGDGLCSCGSALPMLDQIEGRTDAVLITRDGRRIGRLDPVFKGAKGIAEAQIIQDDLDRFRIRVVPGKDYSDADGQVLTENLSQRTGPASIVVELVESIERTSNGKFRAVVCNLPDDVKRNPAGQSD